jgi:hypothetical protein
MSEPQQYTDIAGRIFSYHQGRRVYLDGGKDIGTPALCPPKYYPDELPRALDPLSSASPGLLLETRRLSMVLEKRLGVRVPIETLLGCENLRQLESGVILLLPERGKTPEEREALGDKIVDLSMFCYRWTMRDVIRDFICLTCNQRLGARALFLGKQYYSRFMRDTFARHPGELITVHCDTDAVCPHCRSRYAYFEGTLELLTAEPER